MDGKRVGDDKQNLEQAEAESDIGERAVPRACGAQPIDGGQERQERARGKRREQRLPVRAIGLERGERLGEGDEKRKCGKRAIDQPRDGLPVSALATGQASARAAWNHGRKAAISARRRRCGRRAQARGRPRNTQSRVSGARARSAGLCPPRPAPGIRNHPAVPFAKHTPGHLAPFRFERRSSSSANCVRGASRGRERRGGGRAGTASARDGGRAVPGLCRAGDLH